MRLRHVVVRVGELHRAFTNLHQGFEELHEVESTVGRAGPPGGNTKTSREYVDRLTEWLADHRDVPAFVYLHFFDPHSPYEPYPPYDTMWADPKGREEYVRAQEVLKKFVTSAFLGRPGMATRRRAGEGRPRPRGLNPLLEDWLRHGSIRGRWTRRSPASSRPHAGSRHARPFPSSPSMPTTARSSTITGGFGQAGRAAIRTRERARPLILWGPGHVPKGQRSKSRSSSSTSCRTPARVSRRSSAAGYPGDRRPAAPAVRRRPWRRRWPPPGSEWKRGR